MDSSLALEFDRSGFVVCRKVLPPEAMDIYGNYALMQRQHPGYYDREEITDSQDRYVDVLSESLALQLQPMMESIAAKKLYPTYSWLRIYGNGSELPKHIDRRSSEISASIAVGYDAASLWPIYVESGGQEICLDLEPGDVLVYSGSEVPHWRRKFEGNYWIQLFLFYVDCAGEHAHFRYDGRPGLGWPSAKCKSKNN